jgi:hypothetical protein
MKPFALAEVMGTFLAAKQLVDTNQQTTKTRVMVKRALPLKKFLFM